jgi:hypothetical protein
LQGVATFEKYLQYIGSPNTLQIVLLERINVQNGIKTGHAQ